MVIVVDAKDFGQCVYICTLHRNLGRLRLAAKKKDRLAANHSDSSSNSF